MFKNALVSVSDKRGLAEFLKPLVDQGLRIVSSGGTATYLEEHGFKVVKVSEQTGYPEVMDGRVKTLHPRIHIPLLCRNNEAEDQALLKKEGLEPFDLVIVNLYPFSQAKAAGKTGDELIEYIDIGGPTLLRAAAKSFQRLAVVCDPEDYSWIQNQKELNLEQRQLLAAKVFQHVSGYDQAIAQHLLQGESQLNVQADFQQGLRYGENPQQSAQWYKVGEWGLHQAEILQGKELSYNNILDLSAALQCLSLFAEPTVVSVKHNNPCGVASAPDISRALSASLKADPVSVFGGIIAMNRPLDESMLDAFDGVFLECIIAPEVTESARAKLGLKKNLRVLAWKEMTEAAQDSTELRSVFGGLLAQSQDEVQGWQESWKVVSGDLTPAMREGLEFAWKVCSSLKSNAIAVTTDKQTLGLGMGQVNRVDAVKQAFERQEQFHPKVAMRFLASDAFFPFADSIELAHRYGATAIIQPGGSVRDAEVIETAKRLGLTMVFTGRRHFRH